ncbi:hypothetical protein AB7C87_01725 [Natrarchaeobius sp. A-rgal3]|uniref:hypothetical protein n=1 Tax=Natrarchaeobius versutus TaxID=1679078 RepID=UPI00350EB3E0
MNTAEHINGNLKFEDDPDTQEFLDCFLPALEEQYSYERLKSLSVSQLESEMDSVNNDIEVLRWRWEKDRKTWKSVLGFIGQEVNLPRSVEIDIPTINQMHQINWTITRIERNFNRSMREAKDRESKGLFSRIKRISIGSDQYGSVEVSLSEQKITVPQTSYDEKI